MNSRLLCFAVLGFAMAASSTPAVATSNQASPPWWKGAVFYEIYPRSFQDSNGDGVGDLNGVIERLPYLESLGVDAIWLTPIFPSPQVDFGYDVSDYENVDPQYGTLADLDRLINEAHRHHLRVILDMIPNHTSDQHPWFQEAKGSRDNPKHSWYVWSDGKRGPNGRPIPPNGARSWFGGSAWEWVPGVNQFYFHGYYKQQPELNWMNPAVERAMFGIMRYWLDRGVDGFRLDSINDIFEKSKVSVELAEQARSPVETQKRVTDNNRPPDVHAMLRRMRAMVSTYQGDRVLLGETDISTTVGLDDWYGGAQHNELQLPMDFLVGMQNKLDAEGFRRLLRDANTKLHGSMPLIVFDNHDLERSWDRYGDGIHNLKIARLVAALLLTTRASVLLYQGQEIGQSTLKITRREDLRDPVAIAGWPKEEGRDGERTPMQWDASDAEAGFSNNPNTWLPVAPGYATVNVESELADPQSLLNWYKQLLSLRRRLIVLRNGGLRMLDQQNRNVLSYARVDAHGHGVLVALNMTAAQQVVDLNLEAEGLKGSKLSKVLNSPDTKVTVRASNTVCLPAFGVWIAAIQ